MTTRVEMMKSRIKDLSMQELLELIELASREYKSRWHRREKLGPLLESLSTDDLAAVLELLETRRRVK